MSAPLVADPPGADNFFLHGCMPERQSHGHGASCFSPGEISNSERLGDSKQNCNSVPDKSF